MSSKKIRPNPVFQALSDIQQNTDICPNPQDSDFETCRTKRIKGGRCRNRPCRKDERWHTPSLLLEFQNMTQCPNTQSFYEKMKTFVTYSHCKGKHRDKVLDAFDAWKRKRVIDELISERSSTPSPSLIESSTIQPITAAALQLLPSTPARSIVPSNYATSDDGSSFVESAADTRSVTSDTTCMTSLPNTPLRNGTVSRFDAEDVAEEEYVGEPIDEEDVFIDDKKDEKAIQEDLGHDIFEEIVAKGAALRENIIAPDIKQERDGERIRDPSLTIGITATSPEAKHSDGGEDDTEGDNNEEEEDTTIKGLGIIGIQRTLSWRDHSPVFQVINSHPTNQKMKEGVVYILEHKKNPSLFKIGWSSKSAKERMRQPRNCYGKNTDIFYETKRFVGAPQAERIAQVILRHVNIRVSECLYCQGGHREWFAAPRETVHETVMHVEEFLQMPAYTLQDEVYKLSPEVYERVVKQMCDFSVARFGELMHGPRNKCEETEISGVLIDAKVLPLAQLANEAIGISHHNANGGLSELQADCKSFVSTSSCDTKSQNLSAGAKLMKKVKWFFSISDSVRAYFSDL